MDSFSPSERYSDVPVTPAAFLPAVTVSSSAAFSSANSVVITLVVEAMGYWASAFWSNSTRPLAASISTAPLAATVSASEADAPGIISISISTSAIRFMSASALRLI